MSVHEGPKRNYVVVGHNKITCKHEDWEHGWEKCLGKKGRTACPCEGHWKEERRGDS